MDLSAIGSAVLVAREGRRLAAYQDSVGVWTIGVGHTSAAGPPVVTAGLRLTAQECDAVFARDVGSFVRAVEAVVPADLPGHAFDALVSLCFNIGEGAFQRSTVVRRLKAGDRAGAAEAILMWNRPAAIIPRRRGEYDQFRTAYAQSLPRARSTDSAPIPRPSEPANPSPAPIQAPPAIVADLPTATPSLPAAMPSLPVATQNLPAASDRRPLPRTAPFPRSSVPPAAGAWARLKASLRGLLGRA